MTAPHSASGVTPPASAPMRAAGAGEIFGADLYDLHDAGRRRLPDVAACYTGYAGELDYLTPALADQASLLGGHQALASLLELTATAQNACADTATAIRDTGTALVRIAADYAATDDAAAGEYQRRLASHPRLTDAAPHLPDPPRAGHHPVPHDGGTPGSTAHDQHTPGIQQ